MKSNLTRRSLILILAFAVSSPAWAEVQSTIGLSGSLEATRNTHFYKDPSRAFMVAFFPGLLLHGYGHFYAKDKMAGTALLAGEVISVTAMGVGAILKSSPEDYTGGILGGTPGRVENTGQKMILFGALGFGVTWFVDMLHAPAAAREYNDRYNLQPVASVEHGRPTMSLAYRF